MLVEKESKALTDFQVATFFSTKVNMVSHWSKGRQSKTSPSSTKGEEAVQTPLCQMEGERFKTLSSTIAHENHSEEHPKVYFANPKKSLTRNERNLKVPKWDILKC